MSENIIRNEAWREAMDRYDIHILEREDIDLTRVPEDFGYHDFSHILEVRRGDRLAFCRYEEIGNSSWFGKETWLTRFPDWEGYLFWNLLWQAQETKSPTITMERWLYTYGGFGSYEKNYHEWSYACRAMRDLEDLLGKDILEELNHIPFNIDTDGL